MTRTRVPGGAVDASRVRRSVGREQLRKRNRVIVVVTAGVVAFGTVGWIVFPRGTTQTPDRSHITSARTARTVVLVVRAPRPFIAVIGEGSSSSPAALTVPPHLQLELAGQGSGTTEDLAPLPGDSLRVDLSNVLGMWISHYAVTDLGHLAALVDRAGGLEVQFASPTPIGAQVLGPGAVTLSGEQAKAYLSTAGPDAFTRWETVLQAFFDRPLAVGAADLLQSDDAQAAAAVLAGSKGANVVTFPTKLSVGRVQIPDLAAVDRLMVEYFGMKAPPVPVFVLNGSGAASVGEAVAHLIVPAGFRVVISQNADRFTRRHTQVIATGEEHLADARRVRQALGVGRVAVTQVPSGVADVTIVVGKDFSS